MKGQEYKSPLIEKLLDEVTPEELERADNQMSKKQTAVEWLTEKLRAEFGFAFSDNIFEQAKQMEKQQIIDAFDIRKIDIAFDKGTTSDQYYQETYENNRL